MKIKLFKELDSLARGQDKFSFTFEGKDQEKFGVKVLKKKYPSSKNPLKKDIIYEAYFIFLTETGEDLNGAGIEGRKTKAEILERIKEKMTNFGFKDTSKKEGFQGNIRKLSLNLNINEDFNNIDEITNPNNFELEQRVKEIKAKNTHKTFNEDTIYARIVYADLEWSWDNPPRGAGGFNCKIKRMGWGGENLDEESKPIFEGAKDKIKRQNYPFKVTFKTTFRNFIVVIPSY